MLFYGNIHKGNFIKEIFNGSFIDYTDVQVKNEIICLSERSIEVYEYSYDEKLKLNFLEPILSQDLFIHVLNGKIISDRKGNLEKDLLVLLTSCGLLILKYNPNEKIFQTIASSILNIECEEKDKFMYLKTDSM